MTKTSVHTTQPSRFYNATGLCSAITFIKFLILLNLSFVLMVFLVPVSQWQGIEV